MDRLRFALVFNGESLEKWQLACLDQLETVAELACVIESPVDPEADQRKKCSLLMRRYVRRVEKAETLRAESRFARVPTVRADGESASFRPGGFDFALQFGSVRFPPGALAARHGLWYFEHEREPDLLPFFREVFDGEDVTHAALLAVQPGSVDGLVLEEGHLRTEKRSYVVHRQRVLETIAAWPARVCTRLLSSTDGDLGFRRAHPPGGAGTAHYRPGLFRFCARTSRRRMARAWERLFRHPQWNIGVLETSIETLLAPGGYRDGSIRWFPLDHRRSFLADPFGIERDGTLQILCEEFVYRESSGHISALEYSGGRFTGRPQPVIEPPLHVSYPFLLDCPTEIYCVPETSAADEVALLRATDFPHVWSKVSVLVEHVAGLDPTVFSHDGRWWLLCTKRGTGDETELWAWHAPELLGPWTPHVRNPVKTDVRGARPAGRPFVHDGALYRPTQDCSGWYGWRIAIQRVALLTPSEFVEEPVSVLEPSRESPFPRGRHTLTPVGDVVLLDGHRIRFVWPAFLGFLRIWGRELAGKLRCGSP